MIEGNDQSLEYIGYQVPRSDLEGGGNPDDPENKAQTQGVLITLIISILISKVI